jgi:hypothetical protein
MVINYCELMANVFFAKRLILKVKNIAMLVVTSRD